MVKKIKDNSKKIELNNEVLCSLLSYLLIGIIWWFADQKIRKSNFIKFHVKQGIIFLGFNIIYSIILGILITPLTLISLGLLWPILHLLYYVPLIWMIIGIVNALNRKEEELPIIGKFARKLKIN